MANNEPQQLDSSYNHPFRPAHAGVTTGMDAQLRIAHALEYIAAQLGQINQKLDVIAGRGRVDGGEF